MSIEFMLTSLVLVATPGTGVLYTLGIGLGRGAKKSILAAFSCTRGIVPHLAAALLGFAAKVRYRVANHPGILKWMQRGFAASFGLLAAKTAWADR